MKEKKKLRNINIFNFVKHTAHLINNLSLIAYYKNVKKVD